MSEFWITVLAEILAASIIATGTWFISHVYHKRKIEAAPRKFVQRLDELIQRAIKEGKPNSLINARAIVSTRNDLRDSFASVSSLMNSDIDRLALEVDGRIIPGHEGGFIVVPKDDFRDSFLNFDDELRELRENIKTEKVYETVQVLSRKWPSKKDQIEIELRKILAELGI